MNSCFGREPFNDFLYLCNNKFPTMTVLHVFRSKLLRVWVFIVVVFRVRVLVLDFLGLGFFSLGYLGLDF